ncbi:MAG: hypothetical protein PHE89_02635 [Alphaproteobacteria bacterium]|nr:hypothetical protein [Alphaproteobacteria bacterium]
MKEKIKKFFNRLNYEKVFKFFIIFLMLSIYVQIRNVRDDLSDVTSKIWDIRKDVIKIEYRIGGINPECPDVEVDCLKSYDLLDIERKLNSIDSDISMIRLKIGY